MNVVNSIILDLILTGSGVQPQIPDPIDLILGDEGFNPEIHLMVGQRAYNVDDNIVYKRTKSGIQTEGYLSDAERAKLTGIEANANNYEHPASHPATMISESTDKRFMTDAERTKLSYFETNNFLWNNQSLPSSSSFLLAYSCYFDLILQKTFIADYIFDENYLTTGVQIPADISNLIHRSSDYFYLSSAEGIRIMDNDFNLGGTLIVDFALLKVGNILVKCPDENAFIATNISNDGIERILKKFDFNGNLDNTFNAPISVLGGVNGTYRPVFFTTDKTGLIVRYLAQDGNTSFQRYLMDGSEDNSFNCDLTFPSNSIFRSVCKFGYNYFIIGNSLYRFYDDGSYLEIFTPELGNISRCDVNEQGNVIVSGSFAEMLVMFNADGTENQDFNFIPSSIEDGTTYSEISRCFFLKRGHIFLHKSTAANTKAFNSIINGDGTVKHTSTYVYDLHTNYTGFMNGVYYKNGIVKKLI